MVYGFWGLTALVPWLLQIAPPGQNLLAGILILTMMILPQGSYFLADTHVTANPTAEELVEMTVMSANGVRKFGIEPKIALVSHSNFGTESTESAVEVRDAIAMLHEDYPDLEVDGEMHADAAIDPEIRATVFPNSKLTGSANLLIFPTLDAANISFNLLKSIGEGLSVGPMLLGTAAPAHVISSTVTSRGIVNMSAVAVVEAQGRARKAE